MTRWLIVVGMTLISVARAQTRPTTFDEVKLSALITRLSADDWQERESASREIAALGTNVVPRLERLVAETANEEVRDRASAAMRQIAAAAISEPSCVTMHLKNVTANDAFAELARQTGNPNFRTSSERAFGMMQTRTADIDLDHVSYFSALASLSTAFGVHLQEVGDRLSLETEGGGHFVRSPGWKSFSGPIMVTCKSLTRTTVVQLTDPNELLDDDDKSKDLFNVRMSVFAEPKVPLITRRLTPKIDECVDDRGNQLQTQKDVYSTAIGSLLGSDFYLSVPSKDATVLTRLRGSFDLKVATSTTPFEIQDCSAAKNVSQKSAGVEYVFDSMKREDARYLVHLTIRKTSEVDAKGLFNPDMFDLLDDSGRALTVDDASFGMGTEKTANFYFSQRDTNGRPVGLPVRFVWRLPTEIRTLSVPFDFKNIPLSN